jgi:hypothetical protein
MGNIVRIWELVLRLFFFSLFLNFGETAMKWQVGVFVLMIGCTLAAPCSATFITDVTATVGSAYDPSYGSFNLVDGSGMTPIPVVKTSVTDNHEFAGGMWETAANPAEGERWVKFDFAAPTSLNEMVIWNFNQNYTGDPNSEWLSGLQDVVITYSTADNTGVGSTLFAGKLNCATGAAGQGFTDDLFVPGGPVAGVQAVKIAYTTNWGPGNDGNVDPYFGLSEVRFDNGVPAPEPGTIVLLTTGLIGLLAYAWRKRK